MVSEFYLDSISGEQTHGGASFTDPRRLRKGMADVLGETYRSRLCADLTCSTRTERQIGNTCREIQPDRSFGR